jgi:hypothetical protein
MAKFEVECVNVKFRKGQTEGIFKLNDLDTVASGTSSVSTMFVKRTPVMKYYMNEKKNMTWQDVHNQLDGVMQSVNTEMKLNYKEQDFYNDFPTSNPSSTTTI